MDDVTIKIRAQYVERIIWIVIILILLLALIVVYFKKCPMPSDTTADETLADSTTDVQQEVTPPPAKETTPSVVTPPSEPQTPTDTKLSGKVDVTIDAVSCTFSDVTAKNQGNASNTSAITYTTMKLSGISITVDNQKREMTAYAKVFLWDKKSEDLKDFTITKGTKPLLLGTVKAGEKLDREIRSTEIPISTRQNPDSLQNLRVDILDSSEKLIVSTQRRFNVNNKRCSLS